MVNAEQHKVALASGWPWASGSTISTIVLLLRLAPPAPAYRGGLLRGGHKEVKLMVA